MGRYKVKWYGDKVHKSLNKKIKSNMQQVAIFMESVVKRSISLGNRTGLTPSKPGEPPRVRTGTLRSSIGHEIYVGNNSISAGIGVRRGPATVYADNLEFKGLKDGTTRPFLAPALKKHRFTIIKMLGK